MGNATKQVKTSDQASRAHQMRAVVVEMRRWRGWMSVLGRERRKEVEAMNFWTRTSRRVVFIEWTTSDSGVSFASLMISTRTPCPEWTGRGEDPHPKLLRDELLRMPNSALCIASCDSPVKKCAASFVLFSGVTSSDTDEGVVYKKFGHSTFAILNKKNSSPSTRADTKY